MKDTKTPMLAKVCELILMSLYYSLAMDACMIVLAGMLRPNSPEQLTSLLALTDQTYLTRILVGLLYSHMLVGYFANSNLIIFSSFGCFFSTFEILGELG